MASKRKHRFPSWRAAEEAHRREEIARTAAEFALDDLTAGRVKFITEGKYRAGLSRLDSPSGGIVTVQYDGGHVQAEYAEEWANRIVRHYRLAPVVSSGNPDYDQQYAEMLLAHAIVGRMASQREEATI